MHNNFYASGFLFHLRTQQILLHQPNIDKNSSSAWNMLGGEGKGEDVCKAFQEIILKLLDVKLPTKNIFPVYDYFYNKVNKNHHIFYAEVKKLHSFPESRKGAFSWFTFKQATKLSFDSQTKQDIMVAERVIKAQARDKEALNTPLVTEAISL